MWVEGLKPGKTGRQIANHIFNHFQPLCCLYLDYLLYDVLYKNYTFIMKLIRKVSNFIPLIITNLLDIY